MTSLQYLINFGPTLDNLKSFQWTRKSGILLYANELQHRNFLTKIYVSTNFGLIAVFVKVALEITKRAQHCV